MVFVDCGCLLSCIWCGLHCGLCVASCFVFVLILIAIFVVGLVNCFGVCVCLTDSVFRL